MAVRTKRLAVGISGAAGAFTTIYTCPAAETAIVKELMLSSAVTVATRLIVIAGSGALAVTLVDTSLAADATLRLPMWLVLHPADFIRIYTAVAAGARFWISGTELEGTAD
jgi:hypothetical protein